MNKFMIKFQAYFSDIRQVEVERETDSSVWVNGRKNSKTCDYDSYHDTEAQAKEHLILKAGAKVQKARERLNYEIEQLELLKRKLYYAKDK